MAVSTAVHLAILAAASLFPPPPVEPARTVRIEVIRFQQQGDDSEDWGTIGRVHAIVEGAFPPALDAATIRAIRGVHEHTATATGETKISFVDPGERLWVGGLLVIPGERGVQVGGDLAR